MKRENYIEDKIGRETPFRVPDGYFESFIKEMEEKLPPYPEVPKPMKLSTWHRVRPYVYLAAMFCGIWCMMKIFYTATSITSPLEAPAEHIAMIMENPSDYGVDMNSSSQEDFAVEMEVADSFESASELQEALDREFE